jgi:RHS repeat-associated protein
MKRGMVLFGLVFVIFLSLFYFAYAKEISIPGISFSEEEKPAQQRSEGGAINQKVPSAAAMSAPVQGVDLTYSGDFTFSVPLFSLPGRAGQSYPVALYYNSNVFNDSESQNNVSQAPWTGLGFNLEVGYIYRDFGSSRSLHSESDDVFYLNLPGVTASRLVDLQDGQGTFKSKKDVYAKIEKVESPGGQGTWVVTDLGGTKYYFEHTRTTIAYDVYEPEGKVTPSFMYKACSSDSDCQESIPDVFDVDISEMAYRWDITRIVDTNGNTITFEYDDIMNDYRIDWMESIDVDWGCYDPDTWHTQVPYFDCYNDYVSTGLAGGKAVEKSFCENASVFPETQTVEPTSLIDKRCLGDYTYPFDTCEDNSDCSSYDPDTCYWDYFNLGDREKSCYIPFPIDAEGGLATPPTGWENQDLRCYDLAYPTCAHYEGSYLYDTDEYSELPEGEVCMEGYYSMVQSDQDTFQYCCIPFYGEENPSYWQGLSSFCDLGYFDLENFPEDISVAECFNPEIDTCVGYNVGRILPSDFPGGCESYRDYCCLGQEVKLSQKRDEFGTCMPLFPYSASQGSHNKYSANVVSDYWEGQYTSASYLRNITDAAGNVANFITSGDIRVDYVADEREPANITFPFGGQWKFQEHETLFKETGTITTERLRQLNAIELYSLKGSLMQRIDFDYEYSPEADDFYKKLRLTDIQVSGYDGTTLPSTSFDYYEDYNFDAGEQAYHYKNALSEITYPTGAITNIYFDRKNYSYEYDDRPILVDPSFYEGYRVNRKDVDDGLGNVHTVGYEYFEGVKNIRDENNIHVGYNVIKTLFPEGEFGNYGFVDNYYFNDLESSDGCISCPVDIDSNNGHELDGTMYKSISYNQTYDQITREEKDVVGYLTFESTAPINPNGNPVIGVSSAGGGWAVCELDGDILMDGPGDSRAISFGNLDGDIYEEFAVGVGGGLDVYDSWDPNSENFPLLHDLGSGGNLVMDVQFGNIDGDVYDEIATGLYSSGCNNNDRYRLYDQDFSVLQSHDSCPWVNPQCKDHQVTSVDFGKWGSTTNAYYRGNRNYCMSQNNGCDSCNAGSGPEDLIEVGTSSAENYKSFLPEGHTYWSRCQDNIIRLKSIYTSNDGGVVVIRKELDACYGEDDPADFHYEVEAWSPRSVSPWTPQRDWGPIIQGNDFTGIFLDVDSGDFDNDGFDEAVLGGNVHWQKSGDPEGDYAVVMLDGDTGQFIIGIPSEEVFGATVSSVEVEDIFLDDNLPGPEILVGTDTGYIYIFNSFGEKLHTIWSCLSNQVLSDLEIGWMDVEPVDLSLKSDLSSFQPRVTEVRNTLDDVERQIVYGYDETNGLVNSVTRYGNAGDTMVAETTYAYQNYPGMEEEHMLSQVAEERVYENGGLLQKTATEWSVLVQGDQVYWRPSRRYAGASDLKLKSEIVSYDNYGNIHVIEDALGRSTTMYYGDGGVCNNGAEFSGSLPTCVINEAGHASVSDYDDKLRLVEVKDAGNDVKTNYGYDGLNRLDSVSYPGDGAPSVSYDYNYALSGGGVLSEENLNFIQTTNRLDSGKDSVKISYYDGLARTLQTKSLKTMGGEPTAVSVGTSYNSISKIDSTTEPVERTETFLRGILNGITGKSTEEYLLEYEPMRRSSSDTIKYIYNPEPMSRVKRAYPLTEYDPGYPPGGAYTSTGYKHTPDNEYNLHVVLDGKGYSKINKYDKLGRLVRVTQDDSTFMEYDYDVLGRLNSITDSMSRSYAQKSYDSYGRVQFSSNLDSGSSSFTYYDNGMIRTKTDPRGETVTYAYDALDRTRSVTGSSEGELLNFKYDSGEGYSGIVTQYGFEDNLEDEFDNYDLDEVGNMDYDNGIKGKAGDFVNDAKGIDYSWHVLDYAPSYTISGWVKPSQENINEEGRWIVRKGQWSSDWDDGFMIQLDLNERIFFYQSVNGDIHEIQHSLPLPHDGEWHHFAMVFVYSQGVSTLKMYVDGGEEYYETSTVGAPDFPGGGEVFYVGRSSFDGQMDELKFFRSALSDDQIREIYQGNDFGACGYDVGKLCNIEDKVYGTEVAYTYDEKGRIVDLAEKVNAKWYTTSYDYDDYGNVREIRYPTGETIGFEYNLLSQVETMDIGEVDDFEVTYTEEGNLRQVNYPSPLDTYAYHDYDSRNRVKQIVVKNQVGPPITHFNDQYAYDGVGNLVTIGDYMPPVEKANFSYDNLHRLEDIDNSLPAGSNWGYYDEDDVAGAQDFYNIHYTYDNAGNRKSRSVTGGNNQPVDTVGTYNYGDGGTDSNNRLVSAGACTYSYDAAGNMDSQSCGGNNFVFGYDINGKIKNVTYPDGTLEFFKYSPGGKRVYKYLANVGQPNWYQDAMATTSIYGKEDVPLVDVSCNYYGDLNFDGSVTVADFGKFATCFHSTPSSVDCKLSDFSGDNYVGIEDFGIFAGVFNIFTPASCTGGFVPRTGNDLMEAEYNLCVLACESPHKEKFMDRCHCKYTPEEVNFEMYEPFDPRDDHIIYSPEYLEIPEINEGGIGMGDPDELILPGEEGVESYYYLGSNLIASKDSGADLSYYYWDRMGNTRLVHDSARTEIGEFLSLPFGKQIINNNVKYSFGGKEQDGSGLYSFGARYYDGDSGRFTSVDPALEAEPYAYTKNNPLFYSDPSGASTEESSGGEYVYLDMGPLGGIVLPADAYRDWANNPEWYWTIASNGGVMDIASEVSHSEIFPEPDSLLPFIGGTGKLQWIFYKPTWGNLGWMFSVVGSGGYTQSEAGYFDNEGSQATTEKIFGGFGGSASAEKTFSPIRFGSAWVIRALVEGSQEWSIMYAGVDHIFGGSESSYGGSGALTIQDLIWGVDATAGGSYSHISGKRTWAKEADSAFDPLLGQAIDVPFEEREPTIGDVYGASLALGKAFSVGDFSLNARLSRNYIQNEDPLQAIIFWMDYSSPTVFGGKFKPGISYSSHDGIGNFGGRIAWERPIGY